MRATLRRTLLAFAAASAAVVRPLPAAAEAAPRTQPIPVDAFAGATRGPYRTGTFETLLVDTQREELTTSDRSDKRHLMIQVWYPAAIEGNPPRAPYVLSRELYSRDPKLHWVEAHWLDDVAAVRTNSVLDAPLTKSGKLPVLIYSPGAGFAAFSGTFQTEFLASHGYVVVGISHTGLTGIERFPDGGLYRPDTNALELSEDEARGLTPIEDFYKTTARFKERLMPVQVQDIRFVLDWLQSMNAERGNRFHSRLDLQRVGALGWSLGGAMVLQASRDEPRIKAALNMDGWLFNDVHETGTTKPILVMHSGDPFRYLPETSALERERQLIAETRPWQLYARTDADWYDVAVVNAGHMHFSDLSLFMPDDIRAVFLSGAANALDGRMAHETINRVTLQFFDKHLRQRAAPLLCGGQHDPSVVVHGRGCP